MFGTYPITTPDCNRLDLSSLDHVYVNSPSGKVLTDTVIAICPSFRSINEAGNPFWAPGTPYYYSQYYTYDEEDHLTSVSQWTRGDPYVPPPVDSMNIITQSGDLIVTQEGDQLVTQ